MSKLIILIVLVALGAGLFLTLRPGAIDTSTPEGTVRGLFTGIERRDARMLAMAAMTPVEFQKAKADWEAEREKKIAADDGQFGITMTLLTAPKAEDNILKMLRPKLAEAQQSLGFAAGMFGMAWTAC